MSSNISPGGFGALSRREEQVLSLAAAGFLDKQIAPELGISLNTLRTYWTRIRTKVGELNRSALAVAYVNQLAATATVEVDDPDWEIDLEKWTWRRLSERPFPIPPKVGEVRSLDEILGMFHPDDEPRIRAMIEGLKHDQSTSFSYTARLKPSVTSELAGAVIRVFRDNHGVPVRLVGRRIPVFSFGSDAVNESPPEPRHSWVLDLKSGLILASDAVNELHGLEPGVPHATKCYGKYFFPEDFARAEQHMDELANGTVDTCTFTLRSLASGGSEEVWVTAHGVRSIKGKVIKVIGYRTSLAQAVQSSTAKRVQIGFWAKNLRSREFIVPDQEFCSIYRVDRGSSTLDEDIRSRYLPEDRDAAYDFIDRAVQEGRVRGSHDFKLVFDDGSSEWIRLEFFVESDAEGPYRMSGTVLRV